jgi:hypothetical protein
VFDDAGGVAGTRDVVAKLRKAGHTWLTLVDLHLAGKLDKDTQPHKAGDLPLETEEELEDGLEQEDDEEDTAGHQEDGQEEGKGGDENSETQAYFYPGKFIGGRSWVISSKRQAPAHKPLLCVVPASAFCCVAHAGGVPRSSEGLRMLRVPTAIKSRKQRQRVWRQHLSRASEALINTQPGAIIVSAGFDGLVYEAGVAPAGSSFLTRADFVMVRPLQPLWWSAARDNMCRA